VSKDFICFDNGLKCQCAALSNKTAPQTCAKLDLVRLAVVDRAIYGFSSVLELKIIYTS
jgi:hypothetical protein